MKYLHLILDALLRRRTRTALTLLSVAAAFLLFGLLDVVRVAFDAGRNVEGADRLFVASRLSITQSLPARLLPQLEQVPGVAQVSFAQLFAAYYRDRKNIVPALAVDPQFFSSFKDYKVDPMQLRAFQDDRIGAIVGADLARRYGWKLGDTVSLTSPMFPSRGSNHWSFTVRGLFTAPGDRPSEENQLMFHWKYFNEANDYVRDQVGWFIVKLADVNTAAAVARAIDRLSENSDHETQTQNESYFSQSFIKQFADVGLIATAVTAAVFFTLMLMTGNTLMQAIRERIPELGVLKTLGFTDQTVLLLVLAESLLLLFLGGALGLGLAEVFVGGIAAASGGLINVTTVPADTWFAGTLLMLGVGVMVGLPPALRATRLKIVDALAAH